MELMVYCFLFIFGLCLGSFINVVVYRLNSAHLEGEICRHLPGERPTSEVSRVLGGRSFCPKCKHQLAWHDNIPLLSFVWLRGRCRYCGKKISWQYPLVELATGVLTVLVVLLFTASVSHLAGVEVVASPPPRWLGGLHTPITNYSLLITFLYYLLVTYFLITIFVSDLLYETIPDEISYPAMVMTVVFRVALSFLFTSEESLRATSEVSLVAFANLGGFSGHLGGVANFLLAGLAAAGFFLLLNLATRGRGIGMGDVKLAGLMGLVLGHPKIIVALMLAFLMGALVGVILILLGRKRFGEHLAFGPFLATATWLSLFWGEEIIAFYFRLL